MTTGIIYVLVGRRDLKLLRQSIDLVRRFNDSPITIYSDVEFNIQDATVVPFARRQYNQREANRNSNILRLSGLLASPYDATLYLDNDVFIVDKRFFAGFEIAKKFGLAMAQNPRIFLGTEIAIGADVSEQDKNDLSILPQLMMTYNTGVIFYSHQKTSLLKAWLTAQLQYASRGQMAMWRAFWELGQTPHPLPFQWLVCQEHVGIDNPLALHVGHKTIYEWWLTDFTK